MGEAIKKDIAANAVKRAENVASKKPADEGTVLIRKVLSLILDVRTRWSSSHQMLGKKYHQQHNHI